MKEGLLPILMRMQAPPFWITTMASLFKENVIEEIKRRLKEYGPWGLLGHI